MMDAILYAVRDGLRAQNFGYSGPNLCEIQAADGKPPPGCGNIFVAVCEGSTSNNAMNNLDEYFDWSLVLTMRISVDPDRVGVSLEASKLARKSGPGNPSFNARVEQLRAWGSMNWPITVLVGQNPPSANDNLQAWAPAGTSQIYGFVEPAHFVGAEKPVIVGGDWFTASPDAMEVGLKAEIKFARAR